jgi:hypothetical protein
MTKEAAKTVANATLIGLAFKRAATFDNVSDCSGACRLAMGGCMYAPHAFNLFMYIFGPFLYIYS